MAKDPNNPNSRSSAEWPAPPPYITQEQFNGFTNEFRTWSGNIDQKLEAITQRIAKGDTKFEMLQRDAAECKTKQENHSTLIKTLTTDEAIRKATAAAVAAQPPPAKPLGLVAQAAVTAGVTVLVTAGMGFIYKLFVLDIKQEVKQEEKTDNHPAHHVP